MKKVEKILGYIILVGAILALGLFFAVKGGFDEGMQSINNMLEYGKSVLSNLNNGKYVFVLLGLVIALGLSIFLFIKNLKKKTAFFLAPFAIPAALFTFYLAYRYRAYIDSDITSYKLFDAGLFVGANILELYAFCTAMEILYGKKEENVNILSKLEKIFGVILVALEVIGIVIVLIATSGNIFEPIKNLWAYGINVLTNLSDGKYLALMATLIVTLILAIILFFINLMKGKKVFILAPTTLPIAAFAFFVAYRYRAHLDFANTKKGLAECCLLVFFAVVAMYAIVTSINIIISKKEVKVEEVAPVEEEVEEAVELKESIQEAKKIKSKMTKYLIIEHLRSFGKEVNLNNRANYTKTGLPLADTHYHVIDKDNKVCFAYIYELDGSLLMLLRVPNKEYAKTLKTKYDARLSAFPKQKYPWYSVTVSDKFESDDDVYAVIDEAFNEVTK